MGDFYQALIKFRKQIIETLKKVDFTVLDEGIPHTQIIPNATYSPWVRDENFLDVYDAIKNNTLVDIYRCYELWKLTQNSILLEGDILEVGVWRGGTGCLIAKASESNTSCRVYLADTFEGVVKIGKEDTNYKGGEHSDTNIEVLEQLVNKLQLHNITILKGIFPDQINLDGFDKPLLRLCHIDVDAYSSAKDVFDYVWPLIVKGGAVIFDDYGFWGCEGVTKFCNSLQLKDSVFIHNINGHAIFIKI